MRCAPRFELGQNEVSEAVDHDPAPRGEVLPRDEEQRPDRAAPPAQSPGPSRDAASRCRDASRGDDHGTGNDGKRRSRLPVVILAIVIIIALVAAIVYWLRTRGLETTDDAYTEGNAISIATKASGFVTKLDVNDNTYVKAGQLLLEIDPRDAVAAVDQARANLALAQYQLSSAQVDLEMTRVRAPANLQQAQAQLVQAQANRTQADREYRRQHAVDPRATTQTSVDQATAQMQADTAAVDSANAQVKIASLVQQTIQAAEATVGQRQAQIAQAKANLEQAEANLSYTEVRAPQDGWITQRNVDLGTFVQAGQQVFYIVTPQVWISAAFKENQLADIRPGQPVSVSIDAYPDLLLHGHVDSIQEGSGARFSAFPAENATGNFVKIVRRVPVKIVIDSGLPNNRGLPLGLSVEPTVSVR
jgi:membrane fusion protein, multidrug efflux system